MNRIKHLLLENKAWAQSKVDVDKNYFVNIAKDQTPEYLWIGCADSRVPPSEITGTDPGEMFVHRNIANLVIHTDLNLLSVIQYGVEVLKVPHIIVCGHYNCGGVKAALTHQSFGLIDNWVRNIKDTYFTHKLEVDGAGSEKERLNRLVEYNVIDQIKNLSHTSIIQKSWAERNFPHIHGWVYDLDTGLVKELVTLSPQSEIDTAYKYEF